MSTELAVIDRTAEDLVHQVRLIQEVMGKLMKNGEHYGKIPGCGPKPTLLQPGAQKLCLTFRLVPKYEVVSENLGEDGAREYRVKCTLMHQPTGSFAGEGLGTCSTLEKKYSRQAPADVYNTVLKMAAKRAYVAATLAATAASDIFTQDIEDFGGSEKSGSGAETSGSSGIASPQEVRPTIQEEQDLEGILDRVWDRGDWTYGVIAGVEFSTKRPELAEEIKAHLMQKVRVRVAKYIVTGGKIKFRPRSIEVIPVSPNESETEQEEGEEAA